MRKEIDYLSQVYDLISFGLKCGDWHFLLLNRWHYAVSGEEGKGEMWS